MNALMSVASSCENRFSVTRQLHYSADELFAVVADVKDYPAFVPWCSGARVHSQDEREIIARN